MIKKTNCTLNYGNLQYLLISTLVASAYVHVNITNPPPLPSKRQRKKNMDTKKYLTLAELQSAAGLHCKKHNLCFFWGRGLKRQFKWEQL